MRADVMLDLETLGTAPGSVVLSIGAVEWSDEGLGGRQFYCEVNQLSCRLRGLATDPETVAWWANQGNEARSLLTRTDGGGGIQIERALTAFAEWLRPDSLVWGNGASFDNVILEATYRACGIARPWGRVADRCYRTLKNLAPHVELEKRVGTLHNARDDAMTQAEHAARIVKTLNPWRNIEDAPIDGRTVEVLALGVEGLPDIVCKAAYHPDAGWCVDELRRPLLWRKVS